jgi:iron complex outermembrane receptor protein
MKSNSTLTVSAVVAALIGGTAGFAQAQGEGALVLEEITVTARKTEERLLEAPVSITAFSAADIEEKGLRGLEDIASLAPGVQYNAQGGQIPGRYNSAIRFRGMNVNSSSPSLQLGSLFVDGVYVLGGTHSIPLDDVERIEVIKGPQSAAYGRSTFGGAINYITKAPSLTEWSTKASLSAAEYEDYELSARIEGPIIQDKLGISVGARVYDRGGVEKTSDGGSLGKEKTTTVSMSINFQPVDSFNLKLRAFKGEDNDGPARGGLVNGFSNDSCTGTTVNTQDPAFPVASPTRYVCGAVPEIGSALNIFGQPAVLDQVTTLFPSLAASIGKPNFVYDNLAVRPNDSRVDVPSIDRVGLIRKLERYSAIATFDFAEGYQLVAQASSNKEEANWIRSFGLTPRADWWSRDPVDQEDESYEIRLSSPQDQNLTWLVGANIYEQTFIQSGSGGDAVWLCFRLFGVQPAGPCSGVALLFPNSLAQNTDKVKTEGIFASVNYKFSDAFSISVEGRQQKDETIKAILTSTPSSLTQDKFLPRVIARWTPSEDTNVYASWAKGLLSPIINSEIAQATPRELAQYESQFPGISGVVEGDELDMFELGWKQQWLNGRAQTNIAYYWGDWKNMKGRSVFIIQEDCGSFAHGGVSGATAAAGCPDGATGLPAVLNGQAYVNSRNANVPGDSTLKGIEFEGSILLTEKVSLRSTFTWAHSEYEQFIFNFVQPIAGFTEMKGNQNARFPEFSGSLSASYESDIGGTDWGWFLNSDLNFVGKTYADESNLSYCKDYTTTNVRIGAQREGLRVEAFVRNLFNEDAWAACARWTDFDAAPGLVQLTQYQGIAVTPLMPRQTGLRMSYSF